MGRTTSELLGRAAVLGLVCGLAIALSACGGRRRGGGGDDDDDDSAGCTNTCTYAFDDECDDGGDGSITSLCSLGSDCADCGPRGGGGGGDCPGSLIASCVDHCPEECAARGLGEVCVGAGYEPLRCCYCE